MTSGPKLLGGTLPVAITVETASDLGIVRRLAESAGRAQGFGRDGGARLALVATEMASNLVKHASGGQFRVILCHDQAVGGVTLLSTDRGPGMADASASMIDGFSSVGTLGGGLGAIARSSALFDLHSVPGRGTVLVSQLWAAPPPHTPRRAYRAGAIVDPHPGELVSGDAWAVEQQGDRAAALVVDGLGHGVDADQAARAAVETFRAHIGLPAESMVEQIHDGLRGTRGAAVAVASIDRESQLLRFCGIGNIAARLFGRATSSTLVSRFGIAGHQVRKTQAFDLPWSPDSLLVMHTDGLSDKWTLDVPSLWGHHPLVVAGTVARDAPHRRDDAAVLVIDENRDLESRPSRTPC